MNYVLLHEKAWQEISEDNFTEANIGDLKRKLGMDVLLNGCWLCQEVYADCLDCSSKTNNLESCLDGLFQEAATAYKNRDPRFKELAEKVRDVCR